MELKTIFPEELKALHSVTPEQTAVNLQVSGCEALPLSYDQLLRGEYTKDEWSSQIRFYGLHPWHMMKDCRTEYGSGHTPVLCNGDLDPLMEIYLRQSGK
jgi:hypothetical protein